MVSVEDGSGGTVKEMIMALLTIQFSLELHTLTNKGTQAHARNGRFNREVLRKIHLDLSDYSVDIAWLI